MKAVDARPMQGGFGIDDARIIAPGDPESSHLVQMAKGEETPRMPPNNGQRGFSQEAASKLEAWVKQGAVLDAGLIGAADLARHSLIEPPRAIGGFWPRRRRARRERTRREPGALRQVAGQVAKEI